jgi:hypothetical protein
MIAHDAAAARRSPLPSRTRHKLAMRVAPRSRQTRLPPSHAPPRQVLQLPVARGRDGVSAQLLATLTPRAQALARTVVPRADEPLAKYLAHVGLYFGKDVTKWHPVGEQPQAACPQAAGCWLARRRRCTSAQSDRPPCRTQARPRWTCARRTASASSRRRASTRAWSCSCWRARRTTTRGCRRAPTRPTWTSAASCARWRATGTGRRWAALGAPELGAGRGAGSGEGRGAAAWGCWVLMAPSVSCPRS